MIIAVASGKGGTGKTTIATSMAASIEQAILVDLDVEEPNSYHFVKPEIKESVPATVWHPEIDTEKCSFCGLCAEKCAFNCLLILKKQKTANFFPELCHSCGLCKYVCPENAIKDSQGKLGVIEKGSFGKEGDFYQGILDIGVPMATPLIGLTKESVKVNGKTIIYDSPPGTSCSAVETIQHADYCVLVAEDTPFGESDLEMMLELVNKLQKQAGIIINKSGTGYNSIEKLGKKYNTDIIYNIPFSDVILKGLSKGKLLHEIKPEIKKDFIILVDSIKKQAEINQ